MPDPASVIQQSAAEKGSTPWSVRVVRTAGYCVQVSNLNRVRHMSVGYRTPAARLLSSYPFSAQTARHASSMARTTLNNSQAERMAVF